MKRKLNTIMFIMAFTTLTYNMAHPVTPQLIAEQGHGPAFMGLVFAAMAFANFAMSPVWGRLTDRYGRKPVMLIAPIGYGIAQLGFGYSMSPGWIIFFRLLAGTMASASFIGGTAYIVDVSNREERSKQLAFYTAITGFTGTLGYMLGGWIGNNDYHDAFIWQAIFSFLLGLLIFLVLQESHQPVHVDQTEKAKTKSQLSIQWNMTIIIVLFVVFLTGLIYKGFDISFNSYLKFTLDFEPFEIGLAMAASGLVGLVTNFILYPLFKKRYNDFYLLLTSIVIMAVTALLFIFNLSSVTQVLLIAVFFACLALYKPLLQAILSKMSKRNGEIMGWNNAANSIGLVIGSSALGAIYEFNDTFAFLTLAIVAIVATLLLLVQKKPLTPYVKEDHHEEKDSSKLYSKAK